jgi:hypothetical protein
MPENENSKPAARWLRFSVRGLLVLTLVVAAYLAGRTSQDGLVRPDLAGSWMANLPAGAKQPTSLQSLGNRRWLIRSRAANFNGIYQFADDRLTVVQPADARMNGLVWKWDGTHLVLIAEPPGKPTGSSYLGTVLAPVDVGGAATSSPP